MNRTDFLDSDNLLDEEERSIGNTVRNYANAELSPFVAEWYERGNIPIEIAKGLGKLGVLGMHLEGYGCAGTSATAYGVACRELEAVDSGLRSLVSAQGSLAMFAIRHWGTEEHRQEWLPRMAAGEAIGCFGLTEADAGSDPWINAHQRAPRRRRLGPQRIEDVDHQWHLRRASGGLGADRGRHPRFPRANPRSGIFCPRDPPEALVACFGHGRTRFRQRPPSRFGRVPGGTRPQGSAGAILASNTSSIPIMRLAVATERPGRVIGMHFFNPVPVLNLVEVVPSLLTDSAVTARIHTFARDDLGKHAIDSQDRSAFVVNALLIPFVLSAIRMLESGFATADDIDQGLVRGAAHPQGPLALGDLVGLDTVKAIAESLYEEFEEPLFSPPPMLARMVQAGLLGRKAGRGFYTYGQ